MPKPDTGTAKFREYGFDAFYCEPGIAGAHEKGGVEGEVGRFRRNHLSPMPEADSLAQLNERIRAWDQADDARRVNERVHTVAQDFTVEQSLLAPIPQEGFDPGLVLYPRVSRSSLITVRQAKYSVPVRLIGRKVRVSLRASEVLVFDGRVEVAWHERVVTRGGESVDLDHYLEVLKMKPGALPGSSALAHARATGVFTPAHEAFWAAARKTDGDSAATRQLIEVLLLHRSMAAADVIAGLAAALMVGAVTADVVAVEARRHGATGGSRPERHRVRFPSEAEQHDGQTGGTHQVVSLTQRRLADPQKVIAGLPSDRRPAPSMAGYDDLLTLPAALPADEPPTVKETGS